MVPLLETARLRLREFHAEDLPEHAAMHTDVRVTRHLGRASFSREEAWRRMLGCMGLWPLLGYGYWAVERKTDGRYLGPVGFADFKRDIEPSIEGVPEVGWILAAEAQGQGYATEAARAALAWADQRFPDLSFAAIIARDNAPSIRVAEKLGFDRLTETVYAGEPTLVLRRSPAAERKD